MATTYLTRTPSGSGSQRKFTFSFWVKRSGLSSQQHIFTQYSGSSGDRQFRIEFQANDTMRIYNTDGGTDWILFVTNRVFRDSSAWMHIVVAIDTTQSTESNRVKIYINGSQETSFSTSTYPSLNRDLDINTTVAQVIGALSSSSVSSYFDGSLTHFHFIDNTQYQASDFGETDSTSGIWKPKTAPSVTYGTNGFFLKFENSGAMGTDSSGNTNTFTVSGTLTQNVDTASNNFASLNPLHKGTMLTGFTFANGNNTFTAGSTNFPFTCSTIAVSSGKYYAEFKTTANANQIGIGISAGVASAYIGHNQYDYAYYGLNGNIITNQTSNTTYGTGLSTNDILGVALDATNSKLYFSVNGSWQNSANPSSGTGGFSITAPSSTTTGVYHFALGDEASSTPSVQCNFGSGYFGTTAVASAGTAPSEGGIFEYDCPSGYQSLCTKGINSF
jgi:hypothetical protein